MWYSPSQGRDEVERLHFNGWDANGSPKFGGRGGRGSVGSMANATPQLAGKISHLYTTCHLYTMHL